MKGTRWAGALVAVLMGLGLLAGSASAHTKSTSYSRWAFDGDGARVELRLPLLEMTRFPPDHDWPAYLAANLELLAGDEPCTPDIPTRVETAPGWAAFQWSITCPDGKPRSIRSRLFDGVVSSHLHFARAPSADGSALERVLAPNEPVWSLSPENEEESAGTSLAGYVALGIEHILSGWDHLAFVAALLILSRSFRELATLVTAFTLAHSLTLALAVLGVVRPTPASVEILIGFSIALVAAENGWLLAGKDRVVPRVVAGALLLALCFSLAGSGVLGPIAWLGLAVFSLCHFGLLDVSTRPGVLRAIVAFAFGLVHGFGFAGVLMEVELPAHRIVPALFGFNLGVELGQLAVVAVLWPALRLLARWGEGRAYFWIADGGSAAILGLGLYWVVARNWGAP